MNASFRPNEDDATRGLTLRELVLRVEVKVDTLTNQFENHLREHANEDGQTRGEAKVFGIARSGIAIALAIIGTAISALTALHVI